ncbi:alpha/beta fold hydrolase [Amaricoccus sp.]|uniref:alpha/beta fold hydrolase n=1 Tax=Amaricoccus sp. TaxID=1872485 RepID=UPI001B473B2B|nr:alpha/beta fold hydrolase [Amaricoccus sp.]MBP7242544.1 alpha/beta fold hydrolase [Amaricoccus sp.]
MSLGEARLSTVRDLGYPRAMRRALFALALLAAACAGPPPADPEVRLRSWPARGETRATILALHGFGDTGATAWAEAARYWTSRGIAVYAPDQRGFGENPSWRRWPGAEALVSDATQLSHIVRARHPGVPLVVVGHSMGGGVALAAAAAGLDADALVLAGPAIAGGDALNPVLRAGAWTMAALMPDRRWTGDGVVDISPTDNIEAIRRTVADPRFFGDPSSRELWGLVRIMDMAAAAAPSVETPTLTLMGAHDEVLRPDRVESVHDRIPAAAGWRLYPEGWHWLFRDLHGGIVLEDVATFTLGLRPAAPSGRAVP